jgi:thiamine biosynthesis lipoprotein ApbE
MAYATHRTATWQAFGTSVVLKLAQPRELEQARVAVEAELHAIDYACSRFRADSQLSRVNAANGRATAIDPLLTEALEVALRAAQLTDGDVDPTLGAALLLAGYDRDFSLLNEDLGATPERTLQVQAQRKTGWQTVELDRRRNVVRVPAGVKLDLGATAKAWAADRAASAACKATGVGVLVALGGDVATAGSPPSTGWRVHVTDDHRSAPSSLGQTVAIRGGGLATSSTTVRRWLRAGEQVHHIIDPATGAPARGIWRTVSVAATDCTDANIAATAAILRSQHAPAWLESLALPARLVTHDGEVVTTPRWPVATAEERVAA